MSKTIPIKQLVLISGDDIVTSLDCRKSNGTDVPIDLSGLRGRGCYMNPSLWWSGVDSVSVGQ